MTTPVNDSDSPFLRGLQEEVRAASVAQESVSTAVSSAKVKMGPKDEEWTADFLGAICGGATVRDAAAQAGVHWTLPYKRRSFDKKFRAAWNEAADLGTRLLEQEAARRAYHGVAEPVFYKGEQCGTIQKYSDTLLIFLLKARNPGKYREGTGQDARGPITLNVQIQTVAVAQPAPEVQPDLVIDAVPACQDGPHVLPEPASAQDVCIVPADLPDRAAPSDRPTA